jgi:hypothetical protein
MAVPSARVRICAQASGNWRVSDDGGLEIHRNPIGIVTMLRACRPSGSSVAEGMKKISCNGYRFPPRMRALKSSSDFRSWGNSDFRDMVLPANLVTLGFGSRAETQTETRAAHRQKRCARLPATQPRPRPVRPRPSGHGAPQSLAGLGFPGGRQIPCSGIRIPCSGSNSALKFPARLRREFSKKTMQYQRISHAPFA